MSGPTEHLEEDSYLVTHEVGPNQAGIRLDNFLKDRYRRRSREQLKRAIDEGAVTVHRTGSPFLSVGKLKASSQLVAGDEVYVLSEKKEEPEVCFDYKVIYEDNELFVIEKPANLPVHPAGRYFFNTLLVHLRTNAGKDPLKAQREFYLVHRIDKETSGILVLARDRGICAALTKQFAERMTEKTYLAIVRGVPPETFRVDSAIRRSQHSRVGLKMEIAPESAGGFASLTDFKRLEVAGDFALVECYPKTGRQHQIRLHLESIGHPIVGDKLYGIDESISVQFYNRTQLTPENEARLLLPRHALHSNKLAFTDPRNGKRLEFTSPLPAELRAFLDRHRS